MKPRSALSVLAITAFAVGTLVGCSITGKMAWTDLADVQREMTTQTRSIESTTVTALKDQGSYDGAPAFRSEATGTATDCRAEL